MTKIIFISILACCVLIIVGSLFLQHIQLSTETFITNSTIETRIQYYLNNDTKFSLDKKETSPTGKMNANEIYLVDYNFLSTYNSPFLFVYHQHLKKIWEKLDENLKNKKILLILGDNHTHLENKRIIVKTRPVNNSNLSIINMEKNRHWGPIKEVNKNDISFEQKDNKLIWRGVDTGHKKKISGNNIKRFVLVENYFHEKKWCDVGFNKIVQNNTDYSKYIKNRMSMKEQLRYKYIISVEGNDVASGLKWQLYSNSVVFMTKPTIVSWCMEDKLVPYVHYIPLKDDFSDLKQQYNWAEQNQKKCNYIAEQSTKYIEQFLDNDTEEYIEQEVLRRYLSNII